MSIEVAKYTFGSWLRKGIASSINQIDNLGNGAASVTERSTIGIGITINGDPITKNFELLGPGDVIGINPHMVVRTEPRNWITNFEPNYLPFIEFYDEDFIWRYTPANANGEKLRPWLALLILKQGDSEDDTEFKKNDKKLPLPSVIVKTAESLPIPTQTWAWGHSHINEGHKPDSAFEEFLQSLSDLNNPNSDKIICRLMSPRKLLANQGYRAFVVPAFETGRLAGLGLPSAGIDAQLSSWKTDSTNLEFPIYYEWYFRTGDNEDFESLVKILEPRVMDKRLGIRDMDGTNPGFGMTVGSDIGAILPPESIQTVIGLEGALKAPTTKSKPEVINTTKPFFNQLKQILNFPENLRKETNNSTDPVVSPPIYGENHAITHEIDPASGGWLNQLNRDPRNRVPGGFGTNVIQKNQENYVAKAWAQVQKVLDANRKILHISFSAAVAEKFRSNFIDRLAPEKTILFFSPILKKVKGSPTTLQYQIEESNLSKAAVSVSLRRILRPRGAYYAKLKASDPNFNQVDLIKDLNSGKISPAPPKVTSENIPRIDKVDAEYPVNKLNPILAFLLKNKLWVMIALIVILIVIALLTRAWIICGVLIAAVVFLYFFSSRWKNLLQGTAKFSSPESLVQNIKDTPVRHDFKFYETDPVVPPAAGSTTKVVTKEDTTSTQPGADKFTTVTYYTETSRGKDSLEAKNFREAAGKFSQRFTIKAPERKYVPFDIANASSKLLAATDPKVAFPKMLASLVYFSFNPQWLLQFENLVPAMAYPDFEDPMYEKLRDISSELLIPNLKLIPENTISLLVTNPEFIESYMVGLNHEFGRELLWREYPTDQRGSYFRQFWDVKGIVTNETNLTQEQLTEKYKDIKPLDKWTKSSNLGEHNNRNINNKKQVVLVVRGELLKKYPNTIIYAQKAHIYKDKNGNPVPTKDPVIIEVETEAQMMAEIKFPIFKADIDPDIKFFGFDLTIPQAKGADNPQKETDDWGYYFVIQQIPGEPRFGMDITYEPEAGPISWDDLSWKNLPDGQKYIDTTVKPSISVNATGENVNQWGQNSALMSYILYQKPVMIAVHATEMLENLES